MEQDGREEKMSVFYRFTNQTLTRLSNPIQSVQKGTEKKSGKIKTGKSWTALKSSRNTLPDGQPPCFSPPPMSPATYANNDSHEFFIGSGDCSDESGHLLESRVNALRSGAQWLKVVVQSRYGEQIKMSQSCISTDKSALKIRRILRGDLSEWKTLAEVGCVWEN